MARPCGTAYHPGCFRVGDPFVTRLRDGKGLVLPDLAIYPSFICEACTVRAVTQRELRAHGADWALLALERMRLLDIFHSWSSGTHDLYQSKLKVIRGFERQHSLSILSLTPLASPPVSPAIPLGWCQQQYSLRSSDRSRSGKEGARIAFSTTRGLRSAANQFFRMDLLAAYPGSVLADRSQRTIAVRKTSPADELNYTLMSTGMATRLGEDSIPSEALLACHIRYLDRYLEGLFTASVGTENKLTVARAGFANLCLWLTWCRGQEFFDLRFCDITVILPQESAAHDLPLNTGCLLVRLKPDTKSSRTTQADVVISYKTRSGLSVGRWYSRVCQLDGMDRDRAASDPRFICRHPNGKQWDSMGYRATYLWPSLLRQRLEGEPTLQRFNDTPGMSIPERFYSIHSWRRGGNTHASKKRPGCVRAASDRELDEHGRWTQPRSKQAMRTAYRQWTLKDRQALTLLCM